jgi:hypothetical protein
MLPSLELFWQGNAVTRWLFRLRGVVFAAYRHFPGVEELPVSGSRIGIETIINVTTAIAAQ